MAIENSEKTSLVERTPLPPPDPDLTHVIHMGPNLDRLFRLRPQDLLIHRKTKSGR